ncbi:MAG: hypothetical protein FJX11_14135 [Alphaproteobacteria bacterium]|nr:hypothetical protein [Alphaproteobacteria bacterium]MBM4438309.1 type II toxin-antitoxin system HicB family antitoxin [Actinomycetota bacterium]
MTSFPTYVRKDLDSDYGVEFPDVPECVTARRTIDEARAMAVEALASHLAALAQEGLPIPSPGSFATLEKDRHRQGRHHRPDRHRSPASESRACQRDDPALPFRSHRRRQSRQPFAFFDRSRSGKARHVVSPP